MEKSKNSLVEENRLLKKRIVALQQLLARTNRLSDQTEEDRYRRLVQFLTDYIYTVSIANGEVVDTYHGPGCLVVTGYSSEEYLEDTDLWHSMVVEEDRELVTDMSNRALAGEQIEPFEHRILHKDGSVRWVRNSMVLNQDASGKMISYDGLIRDITEKKHAERLAEIHREQLVQADKMASIGVLVSGVAHEINNPNNFIVLNSRLLERVINDARPILDEYLQKNGDFSLAGISYAEDRDTIARLAAGIVEGSTRIKEIIGNLKHMTGPQQQDHHQSVDLNAVATSAVLFVKHVISKSTENFEIKLAPTLPLVKGIRQQLEQVVMNLLTNAAHAIEKPDQRIMLSTRLDLEQKCAILEVFDEGVGIPRQNINRIFDPFFTTKRHLEGSGLGLSISWQVLLRHNGSLDVHSEAGKGTTFIVKLPLMESIEVP